MTLIQLVEPPRVCPFYCFLVNMLYSNLNAPSSPGSDGAASGFCHATPRSGVSLSRSASLAMTNPWMMVPRLNLGWVFAPGSQRIAGALCSMMTVPRTVSYTHLTLPTNREV